MQQDARCCTRLSKRDCAKSFMGFGWRWQKREREIKRREYKAAYCSKKHRTAHVSAHEGLRGAARVLVERERFEEIYNKCKSDT